MHNTAKYLFVVLEVVLQNVIFNTYNVQFRRKYKYMPNFKIFSEYSPSREQNNAIAELVDGYKKECKYQTLLGVTGSGKTFTIANVIEKLQKPTLVITHNKTLAAQLYSEFRKLFPNNAVEYFVSYYDYYQPEAYIPATDTYIAKDASINDEIEKLRLSTTSSLMSRKDVIVVSSVSCIYSLGSPVEYEKMTFRLSVGEEVERDDVLKRLVKIQYRRNDIDFSPGCFRVRGENIDIYPAYERKDVAIRIHMFGDDIEKISRFNTVDGRVLNTMEKIIVFPARHFVTEKSSIERALIKIKEDLGLRLDELTSQNKLVEAQRLESRTKYDLEMISEIGYCSGIENYSRYFDGRKPGSRPNTLMDFFPKNDYLMIIDESHVTLPQIGGMYEGDRSRKQRLIDFGFRLPSALDNRPLKTIEFEALVNKAIFLSATPREEELKKSEGIITELVIRPTGLVDPEVILKPVNGQIDDLMEEIRICVKRNERVLVTTLTKKMSEQLTEYFLSASIKVMYLHSEIDTLKRTEILRQLRKGEVDVLVGINLLREGLDLPETSLVAILDADKEGFLRSTTSIIQTAGRASRNVNGRVILYADKITKSMRLAMDEMERRREVQLEHNKKYNITPKTVIRSIDEDLIGGQISGMDISITQKAYSRNINRNDVDGLREQMLQAASNLEFEKAAKLRDKIKRMENK